MYWLVGILLFSLFGLFVGFFDNQNEAVKALQDGSYRDVKITDHHYFGLATQPYCGQMYTSIFDATATNSQGQQVSVSVCYGFGRSLILQKNR